MPCKRNPYRVVKLKMFFCYCVQSNKMTGQFWKVLRDNLFCDGFQCQEGLNTTSFDPNNVYRGGFICTDTQNVGHFLRDGTKIARVTIPDGTRIVRLPTCDTMFKAERIIISDIIDIKDWYMWENPAFCLNAVKQDGYALFLAKIDGHPDYAKMCLEAVKTSGWVLEFVKPDLAGDLYTEICVEAVKVNWVALKDVKADLVKDRYAEICMCAVKQYGIMLQHVKDDFITDTDLYYQICLCAVKQRLACLKYVNVQRLKDRCDRLILEIQESISDHSK